MVCACTIIARNYMAHARVLARSFFDHHPGGEFTVLLIDDEERRFDARDDAFRCLRLSDIELDAAEIRRLAAVYDVTELATAVKPPLLKHMLHQGRTDLIYLDPDIKLYGSLESVSELARTHSIVLTPHTLQPVPRDQRRIDEFQILAAGVYNLGFIAVSSASDEFLDWWWLKTRREARSDPQNMMFTDQRWVDFVPSFFTPFILKDPAYNVAYWNLHARELTWSGERYLVGGQPLQFFHFSGFDHRRPYLLSKHQGDRPRILLSERPALARICREYAADLDTQGVARESALPYGWKALASGAPLDRKMRRVYREQLLASENDGGTEPPNPFEPGKESQFMAWLNEPVAGGIRPRISRYLYAIYQDRPDLQQAFRDLAGPDWIRYLEWVRLDGVRQENIPDALVPARPVDQVYTQQYATPSEIKPGINIAGYFRAEVGVGEAARLLTSAVEAAGISYSTLTYDATLSRKEHEFVERGDRRAPYDVNVVCVNALHTPEFMKNGGRALREGRHTVGFWFWELEHFPPTMHAAFDYVDEVWTATRFVTNAVAAIGRRPVHTVPLPIPVPRCAPLSRSDLRLPPGFMFLFMFDLFSVVERKNPFGLITAFTRAFQPGEGPILVIKTINGHLRLNDLERVRTAAAGRPDIVILDEYYTAEQKNALLGLCDCYVSLHRSEGFGLTMAEAMGLEKPVIATGYSGNVDFMTPHNSFLVDYVTGSVPAECAPYPVGSAWADPNLDQAAEFMRTVVRNPKEAARRAAQARQDILTKHTVEAAAETLKRRMDGIRGSRMRNRRSTDKVAGADGVTTDDPSQPPLSPLDRVTQLLTPTQSVQGGTRFGRARLMAQGLLFKVLRPYWWQQRQIQTLLIEAIRDASGQPGQRRALEPLWQSVQALENANRSNGQVVERLIAEGRAIPPLQEHAVALQQHVAALQEQAVAAQEQAGVFQEHVASFEESAAGFQEAAGVHLKALTEQLAVVTRETSALGNRLFAVPYMSEPDRFYYRDADGKRVLGFQSRRPAEGDECVGFEDIFRGSEPFIRERLRAYLPLLRNHDHVVEVGCGRGELLDLLKDNGIPAVGIDIDEAMVRRCRLKGHNAEVADVNQYLRAQPDSSVPAIFSAQVVEHLSHEEFLTFLRLSRAKLKPGGQLIFESVNPHALEAFKTFFTDLTHERPIFPEVALAWCWLEGFDQAYVFFPNGNGDLEHDRMTQGEYAIVARKDTATDA